MAKKKPSKKKASKKKATKKGVPGRPSTITKPMIKKVCEIVSRGNFRKTAFGMLGIESETWKSWIKRGRAELKEVREGKREKDRVNLQGHLVTALIKAEATLHDKLLVNVLKKGDPELQFKFMRYRWNREYNNNPNSHFDDESGTETKIDPHALVAQRLKDLMER